MAGHVPPTHKTHAAQFLNQLVEMTSNGPAGWEATYSHRACLVIKHQAAPDLSRFARPKSCGERNTTEKQATKRFGLEQAIYIYGSVILFLIHFVCYMFYWYAKGRKFEREHKNQER